MLTSLTKSRFKLGLECPTKVFYASNRDLYANAADNDDFLQMLAYGGHQVGALAKLFFLRQDPSAVEVTERNEANQVALTKELMARDNVTVFEGTLKHGNLVLRADVLRKNGPTIDLIEVKATGWNPLEDSLTGKTARSNPLSPAFESYVYDVAFQHHLASLVYPDFEVRPWLMFLDTTLKIEVEGLATAFTKSVIDGRTSTELCADFDWASIESLPIVLVDAKEAVHIAKNTIRERRGKEPIVFSEAISALSLALETGTRLQAPLSGACKSCTFYSETPQSNETQTKRSGWHECMKAVFPNAQEISRKDSIFGFYGQTRYEDLLPSGSLSMKGLSDTCIPSDLGFEQGRIPPKLRQRFQYEESKGLVKDIQLDAQAVREIFDQWVFPLHFIDFETSRVALPYFRGQGPYQQVLFQFSHHCVSSTGQIEHRSECLIAEPGLNPSVDVLRALMKALDQDQGTVFHWYPHERTVLSEISREIDAASHSDAHLLKEFLESLGLRNDSNRRMFDLGRFFEQHVFVPGSLGSSSMKRVLPALFKVSPVFKALYSTPSYGTTEIPSKNYSNKSWYVEQNGTPVNPYDQLASRFSEGWVESRLKLIEEQEGEVYAQGVADGAAAIIAFDKLQSKGIGLEERSELLSQLKRYCELDTLAMVMCYQAIVDRLEKRLESLPRGLTKDNR